MDVETDPVFSQSSSVFSRPSNGIQAVALILAIFTPGQVDDSKIFVAFTPEDWLCKTMNVTILIALIHHIQWKIA